MAIFKTHENSNPRLNDAVAKEPFDYGQYSGEYVSPDMEIPAEIADKMTSQTEHKLNRDDLRAAGTEAKAIKFEGPATLTQVAVVERAQKSTMDSREVEDAGNYGIRLVTERALLHRTDILDLKEMRCASIATTSASFGTNHKESAVNFATADLIKKVDNAQYYIKREGRYGKAKFGLIGELTYRAAMINTEFAKFCAQNPGNIGVLTSGIRQRRLAALAEFLGLDEIRIADYNRVFEGDSTPTDFWPTDFFLVFNRNKTFSNRTFMQTAVVPYGEAQGAQKGTVVDVRTAKLSGTDGLTEVGAYHRYQHYLLNADAAFLFYETTGHA